MEEVYGQQRSNRRKYAYENGRAIRESTEGDRTLIQRSSKFIKVIHVLFLAMHFSCPPSEFEVEMEHLVSGWKCPQ